MPVHTSATCSATIFAPPEMLVAYVSDPLNLPVWAPGFATTVSSDVDGTWLLKSAEGERRIIIRASIDLGVVDFVSAADPQWGAFMRVLPSGAFSIVTFSHLFPGDAAPEVVDAAMRDAAQGWPTFERSWTSGRVTQARDAAGAPRRPAGCGC